LHSNSEIGKKPEPVAVAAPEDFKFKLEDFKFKPELRWCQ
jgi:hypothetical protein